MTAAFLRWPLLLSLLSVPLLWLASPGGGDLWTLLFVALVPLLLAIPRFFGRSSFLAGNFTGCLIFLTLLHWIVFVLGHYGGLPIFISIPALVLLSIYMGLYLGLFFVLAGLIFRCLPPLLSLFFLPALWVGLDWLRSVAFSGFPWLDLGYFLWAVPQLVQTADLLGHYGLTYGIVLINTFLALMFMPGQTVRRRLQLAMPMLVVAIAAAGYSRQRWQQLDRAIMDPLRERMWMGVVQGNIDQALKWSPENQQATVATYLRETISLFNEHKPELVVWPETALPFYPPAYKDLGVLHNLTAQYDMALLTGAPWYEVIDRKARKMKFFNSAVLLQPDGKFSGRYDKSHLVPFGEYVPLKKFLPFIAPLVEAVGDFTPGQVERPLVWRQAKAGVLICFESIFADIARSWVNVGANVLVNLTNDAWYGRSSAPRHSMAMSVLRAVETRRSLVRAANTGISGFVDPLGRVRQASAIFETRAMVDDVVLMDEKTVFVRYGYLFAPLCLFLGAAACLSAFFRRRQRGGCSGFDKNTV
jgi:apolipoprotein N-acyltransferase